MESKPRDKATETRRVPLSGNYKGPYATLQQFFYLSNSNYTLRAYWTGQIGVRLDGRTWLCDEQFFTELNLLKF